MSRTVAMLCLCILGITLGHTHPVNPASPAEGTSSPHIIPQPARMTPAGGVFVLTPRTIVSFAARAEEMEPGLASLTTRLRQSTGFSLRIRETGTPPRKDYLLFAAADDPALGREGYRLNVQPDGVRIEANAAPGFFYAVQSFLQLLPPDVFGESRIAGRSWEIPCVAIVDTPRYAWRGMMLDVSRHFFPVSFVKKFINELALHKMNTFHWHLNDDQGWRVEIKAYPELTGISAWRVDHEDVHWNVRPDQRPEEKATYGGFYTQAEIREVVRYAAERCVTIVPEIEMPAHATAVISAFPQFSCTGGPFTVPPGGVWPIKHIYCAGTDSTFLFLETVLREVADLFPGSYIHIGGDEADKTEWRRCPKCQARIRAEGLADETALQSYFTRRIETFLASINRRLIGWDEIIEGGLPPRASVMSWRGTEGGIAAARSGHDVVMTPTSNCYFDYYQADPMLEPIAIGGFVPLETVYSFEPTPDSLSPAEAAHIIGAGANLWTEYIPDPAKAEYMIFPRIAAIAEVGWTARERKSWPDFLQRLDVQLQRYAARSITVAPSIFRVAVADSFDVAAWRHVVTLTTQSGREEIRYTLNGSIPTAASPLYDAPIMLYTSARLRARAFTGGIPAGPGTDRMILLSPYRSATITLTDPPESGGNADGGRSLLDHQRGTPSARDSRWSRWRGNGTAAVVDLGTASPVRRVSVGFLHQPATLTFSPGLVVIEGSLDGSTFQPVAQITGETLQKDPQAQVQEYSVLLERTPAIRFVKISMVNPGPAPAWHKMAGEPTWIAVDEIVIE